MIDPGLYAVALGAGALAALNPCGFALLPTYLLLLVDPGESTTSAALGRALRACAAMTVGFVAVFAVFAALVVPLSLAVEQHLPWVTVVIGVALVALGVRAAGRDARSASASRSWAGRRRVPAPRAPAVALYGVAYATASLSCTVAPFLALASTATRTQSLAGRRRRRPRVRRGHGAARRPARCRRRPRPTGRGQPGFVGRCRTSGA